MDNVFTRQLAEPVQYIALYHYYIVTILFQAKPEKSLPEAAMFHTNFMKTSIKRHY
jgi:hypothetical protein